MFSTVGLTNSTQQEISPFLRIAEYILCSGGRTGNQVPVATAHAPVLTTGQRARVYDFMINGQLVAEHTNYSPPPREFFFKGSNICNSKGQCCLNMISGQELILVDMFYNQQHAST